MNTITTMKMRITSIMALLLATALMIYNATIPASAEQPRLAINNLNASDQTQHRTITVDGLNIFYREAGSIKAPTIILLQGLPTSSERFLDIIPVLSQRFHVVAPDYPGYGNSDKPGIDEFNYSLDNLSAVMDSFVKKLGVQHYGLLVKDQGTQIGVRLTLNNPQQVEFLLVHNGDKYEDRLPDIKSSIQKYWNRKPEYSKPLARLMNLDYADRYDTRSNDNETNIDSRHSKIYDINLSFDGNYKAQFSQFSQFNNSSFSVENDQLYRQQENNIENYLLDKGDFYEKKDIRPISDFIRQFMATRVLSL